MIIVNISPSERRASLLSSIAIASLVLIVLTSDTGSLASPLNKKSDSPICPPSSPCGWLVYQEDTRLPDYYVKSLCSCPSDQKCVQGSDDVTISSYIYRCMNSTLAQNLDVLKEERDSEPTPVNVLFSRANGNQSSGDTSGE